MNPSPSTAGMVPPPGESAAELTIAALRTELGLTQEEFGGRIGLTNKTSVSLLENGKRPSCPVAVALAIEALSGGRIDAARLSEDVRAARHGLVGQGLMDHGADDASAQVAAQ